MGELSEADRYLLDQVRRGSDEGWSQLVQRYQGRLGAFARSKVRRAVEAEDLVQETFVSFLKGLDDFREEAAVETYLFTILRRKIADWYRGKSASVCLLQDVVNGSDEDAGDAAERLAGREPTASWYARRGETHERQREALTAALRDLIGGYRKALNFRDLQVVEMVFYCRIRNKDVAKVMGLDEKQVALIKHRALRQIRDRVDRDGGAGDCGAFDASDTLVGEIWQDQRLSCLKRSTIGAFLLGTLDAPWQAYVGFHLERLGCGYCLANLADLKSKTERDDTSAFRNRILESTVGFLRKS